MRIYRLHTKKMNKYLRTILKEMSKRVDADFDSLEFTNPDWFRQCEWTEEEQNEFNKWLIKYLRDNTKARNELMSIPSKNKVFLQKFADSFSFNYGWKLK